MRSGFDSCLHKKLIREGTTSKSQAQVQERVGQVALSLIPGQLIIRVFEIDMYRGLWIWYTYFPFFQNSTICLESKSLECLSKTYCVASIIRMLRLLIQNETCHIGDKRSICAQLRLMQTEMYIKCLGFQLNK